MSERMHPNDPHATTCAPALTSADLTTAFEHALRDREEFGAAFAVGALEVIASVAIARVRLLEQRSTPVKEERRVKSVLYPRGGNVIALPTRGDAA